MGLTNNLIELLPVIKDQGINLSCSCLINQTLGLLSFVQLLNRGVHALLKDGNLLILLFADPLDLCIDRIQLAEQIVDLDLLALHNTNK